MSYPKWKDIKKLSTKELISKHDELASEIRPMNKDILEKEMQTIRDEIDKREKYKKSKVIIAISVVALLFSSLSLIISYKSCSISEKQYSLNLEPLLNIQFFSYYDSAKCFSN